MRTALNRWGPMGWVAMLAAVASACGPSRDDRDAERAVATRFVDPATVTDEAITTDGSDETGSIPAATVTSPETGASGRSLDFPARVARQRWVAEHPDEDPIDVPDEFVVNDNGRTRRLPLAPTFVQADAQWDDADRCLPPDDLPPSGSTQVYRLLDSWLSIAGGEAKWVLTSCL